VLDVLDAQKSSTKPSPEQDRGAMCECKEVFGGNMDMMCAETALRLCSGRALTTADVFILLLHLQGVTS
jgi:hypothetical protein